MIPLAELTDTHWQRIDDALVPLDDDGLSGAVLIRVLDVTVSQIGREEARTALECFLDVACDMQMERDDRK